MISKNLLTVIFIFTISSLTFAKAEWLEVDELIDPIASIQDNRYSFQHTALNQQGTVFAASTTQEIVLIDHDNWTILEEIWEAPRDEQIVDIEFASVNDYLIIACSSTVYVVEVTTGEIASELTGNTDSITSLAVHPTLPIVAFSDESGNVVIWDLNVPELIQSSMYEVEVPYYGVIGISIRSMAFSPSGDLIALGPDVPITLVADVATLEADFITSWVEREGDDFGTWVAEVLFSDDGAYYGALMGGKLLFYDSTTGELLPSPTILDSLPVTTFALVTSDAVAVGILPEFGPPSTQSLFALVLNGDSVYGLTGLENSIEEIVSFDELGLIIATDVDGQIWIWETPPS